MLVARLQLFAHTFTFILFNFLNFFSSHQMFAFVHRVIYFVTLYFHASSTAFTFVFNQLVTAHAFTIMALLYALMFPTRQESLTKGIAGWYWFSTVLSLPTDEFFDWVMPTRTKMDSGGISLTWRANSCMTLFLAGVVVAVEHSSTDHPAAEFWLTTFQLFGQLWTETVLNSWDLTRLTRACMARWITPMDPTIKDSATILLTGEFGALRNLTRDKLANFFTMTLNWDTDVTGWACTRMAID